MTTQTHKRGTMMIALRIATTALALLLALPGGVRAADDYPRKPITLTCPFGAGSGADIVMRAVMPMLKEALGTEIVMDYKTGATGIVGTNFFMTRKADGYSLLTNAQPHILLQERFMKTAFKSDDLIPLVAFTFRPDFLVVRTDDERFPDFQAVLDYAKANPGRLSVGTTGVYSGNHLSYVLLEKATGLAMTRVPFESGGKMVAAMLGAQVDVMLTSYSWVDTYPGKLRGVASCTQERVLADIPTMEECGVDNVYDTASTNVIYVRKGVPEPVLTYLRERLAPLARSEAVRKALYDAHFKQDNQVFDWRQCEELTRAALAQIDRVTALLGVVPTAE